MKGKNEISRKLQTMIPLDVYADLNKLARKFSFTGLGKIDYGVTLRFLIEKYDEYELVYKKLIEQDERLMYLESRIDELTNPSNQKSKSNEVKTFGSN